MFLPQTYKEIKGMRVNVHFCLSGMGNWKKDAAPPWKDKFAYLDVFQRLQLVYKISDEVILEYTQPDLEEPNPLIDVYIHGLKSTEVQIAVDLVKLGHVRCSEGNFLPLTAKFLKSKQQTLIDFRLKESPLEIPMWKQIKLTRKLLEEIEKKRIQTSMEIDITPKHAEYQQTVRLIFDTETNRGWTWMVLANLFWKNSIPEEMHMT